MNPIIINTTTDFVECQPMTIGVRIAIFITVLLLFISGFASGSEIAFFSLSPNDIAQLDEERERDKKILMLREDSERTLATILITNNFVNVTIIMLLNYAIASVVDFGSADGTAYVFVAALR